MSGSSHRLFEFLETQQGVFFNRLYQQPSTALAIFRRMLPHLAKTIVMSMLFLGRPMPVSDIETWVRSEFRGERERAISSLERLRILTATSKPGKPRSYALTSPFSESLRNALTGGGSHASFGVPCNHSTDKERISIDRLDEFARTQWEGILGYMVGNAAGAQFGGAAQVNVADGVKKLLQEGGLVSLRGRKTNITQDGFTFVLKETNAQVWTLLVEYLGAAELINMDPGDVLSFLFQLGSLELGQDYSKSNLSPTQLHMLDDLSDLGLVYQTSSKSKRFYPTRLATTLTSDADALRDSTLAASKNSDPAQAHGFIVLETNYRLYAYTSSPLQIAILSLFCRLGVRFPNLVTGKITRSSVREAVSMGITAEQILNFLTAHAHPQMRRRNPVLPPAVMDQIGLWQIENERMESTSGFLFKDFASQDEFEGVVSYASDLGVLKWKSEKRRMCFVTEVQQIASYIKSKKNSDKQA